MKSLFLAALSLLLASNLMVAQPDSQDEEREIVAVTELMLEIVSGVPGDEYDWDTFLSLFMPNGNLSAIFPDTSGNYTVHEGMVQDWISRAGPHYERMDFFETADSTFVLHTGKVAQVWQYYHTYTSTGDTLSTGVNAYHLIKHEGRWKVAHLMWDTLTEKEEE
ncbi:hypothetical protein [Phaeocystidibacter luteus]|uniref:Nuclear transport factor 2 family protein n=1 Tax=Phaeocystidibacter luteus TaxID=911197 RepID=A0A6N6RH72_9FLAO|nr:hypothetical protein [Phaeocystidibacter luteus]KAB2808689.1 hypothetical protein F8C67_10405 [Phaeocystidibacter luteus]